MIRFHSSFSALFFLVLFRNISNFKSITPEIEITWILSGALNFQLKQKILLFEIKPKKKIRQNFSRKFQKVLFQEFRIRNFFFVFFEQAQNPNEEMPQRLWGCFLVKNGFQPEFKEIIQSWKSHIQEQETRLFFSFWTKKKRVKLPSL